MLSVVWWPKSGQRGLTASMRTTGAHDVRATSPAHDPTRLLVRVWSASKGVTLRKSWTSLPKDRHGYARLRALGYV